MSGVLLQLYGPHPPVTAPMYGEGRDGWSEAEGTVLEAVDSIAMHVVIRATLEAYAITEDIGARTASKMATLRMWAVEGDTLLLDHLKHHLIPHCLDCLSWVLVCQIIDIHVHSPHHCSALQT